MKKELTEAQKYQKKKNGLIMLFMFLLLGFVGLMCFIVIVAKTNPVPKFLSQDEIEIVQMRAVDHPITAVGKYFVSTGTEKFTVTDKEKELNLVVNNEKQIMIIRNGVEEQIKIMLNNENINNNIKTLFQTKSESLILKEDGKLYKLIDTRIIDGQLTVGQIAKDVKIKNLVKFIIATEETYALTDNGKVVNINSLEEYQGIIKTIRTNNVTIYVYEDHTFGVEKGKVFIDQNNNFITINVAFDNKIIGDNNVIYEINPITKNLLTSNLGEFTQIGYKKNEDNSGYEITLFANTGMYDLNSSYYYKK